MGNGRCRACSVIGAVRLLFLGVVMDTMSCTLPPRRRHCCWSTSLMSGISRAQESASADTAADGSDLNDRNGSGADAHCQFGSAEVKLATRLLDCKWDDHGGTCAHETDRRRWQLGRTVRRAVGMQAAKARGLPRRHRALPARSRALDGTAPSCRFERGASEGDSGGRGQPRDRDGSVLRERGEDPRPLSRSAATGRDSA